MTSIGNPQRPAEPRIVTPQEAQRVLEDDATLLIVGWRRLAETVATEPDRTRAAVVEALRNVKGASRRAIRDYANDIESGVEDL